MFQHQQTQKRRLGADGPLVSAIGVGAMSFTAFYGATTQAASHGVLRTALELGIDHLDTSDVYGIGISERVIGSFLGETALVMASRGCSRWDEGEGWGR